ncbi:putative transporter [Porphyromonadaceae bacterium W3.11]|nr:putative transporter [Porphyromonadaceae bacterium W3.11]
MNWLNELLFGSGVAHSLFILAITIMLGIILGRIKIAGISLGATLILFVGIFFGELGMSIDQNILHFFKEFGLILFVFSIGLQVGPGFFNNFKKGGSKMNLLALILVLLGVITTIVIYLVSDVPLQTMVGIMSGAITNTPGLGAAQQAYSDIVGVEDPSIALGYAVAYPLGVIGIILSLVLLKRIGKISLEKEEQKLIAASNDKEISTIPLSLEVLNPSLFGITVQELSRLLPNSSFVVSRILKKSTGNISIANSGTIIEEGDKIFVITEKRDTKAITATIGKALKMERSQWTPNESKYNAKKIVVTKKNINGKSLKQLNLRALYGVNVTRIYRSGVQIVASPDFILQYGDRLNVVGSEAAIDSITPILGNSVRHLNEPNLVTIFLGIALGILLGSIPFIFPGIPQPVKLGLAGGPLIVAILIARFGHHIGLVSYTTTSANLMLREIGISVFLACVGLGAGNGFVDTLVNNGGFVWVGYGLIITIVPIIITGIIGLFVMKINYLNLCGLIAGATTDPPALAYATSLSATDNPAVSYATVYPLTMFMRVLAAQLLVIFLL